MSYFALVKNGVVESVGVTEELAAFLLLVAGENISLPEDPSGISIAGYDIMPVNVIGSAIPDGNEGTGQFNYTVNGAVIERTEAYAPMTQDKLIASLTAAVQKHLDDTAKIRNYDGILSLCSYATSANTKFGPEGQAGLAWRDAVWAKCYNVLASVQAGSRGIPTAAELIAELPTITWPA